MMSKFIGVFRELSTFTELLHTQIELILVERLHHNWLKVMLPCAVLPISCYFVCTFRVGRQKTVMQCLRQPSYILAAAD